MKLLLTFAVLLSCSSISMADDDETSKEVFVIDLSNIDHANGAEMVGNYTEEDTKIIPTNIDFAALKEVYAKENKAERFLASRLFFDDKNENDKRK